jgi:hypothetical protein
MRRDPLFSAFLVEPKEQPWNAILLSAGGNDLIHAVQKPAIGKDQVHTDPPRAVAAYER